MCFELFNINGLIISVGKVRGIIPRVRIDGVDYDIPVGIEYGSNSFVIWLERVLNEK